MASTTQSWAAATQSWASWLLDSYASSVSPLATETSFDQQEDSHYDSQPVSEISYHEDKIPVTAVSMSPAYGPYIRTGRGGAGNYNWDVDLKLAPRAASPIDLEANIPQRQISLAERRKASARLEAININETARLRQNSAQYLSYGRGGAGNYTPNTTDGRSMQRSATLPATLISPITPRSPSPNPRNPYPTPHPGRGGAGNYAAVADAYGQAETEKQHKERLAAQLRREQIVGEVNELLQPPPGAWLGGRRKSELFYEVV
ncbi:hypothetical protein H2200_007661 [Cladophialophora chaetospira]|uniref:Uncharacterized protein n=1 Tax=Cladophialophora chaetospira TaxID=386627 RepID=A0AA38X6N8_9EURO|nr:hypothetical protein H2200_007661 [Cladophialophora chaetospira]